MLTIIIYFNIMLLAIFFLKQQQNVSFKINIIIIFYQNIRIETNTHYKYINNMCKNIYLNIA